MKLRRVGSATGLTLRKDLLDASGLAEGDEVEVTAAPGEIRIRRASREVFLPLPAADLQELAKGRVPRGVQTKARKLLKGGGNV